MTITSSVLVSLDDVSALAPSPAARLHLALCGSAGLILALLWWTGGGFVFPLDDAYITLHNARVLLDGHDPNYGVSALIGATSLAHLALVAALSALMPPETGLYVLSAASILLLISGVLSLALQHGLSRTEAAALAIAAVLAGAMQLLNGLETGLAMAVVTWTLVLAARPRPTFWLAALCGTLPFLRPELGLLVLALMARQAWLRIHSGAPVAIRTGALARDAGIVVAAAVPWLIWSWIETGALIPNTLAAKQAFFALPMPSFPVGLGFVVTVTIAVIGPSVVALVLGLRDSLVFALAAFVGLFVLGFASTMPEAVTMNSGRYAFALIPPGLFALCRLASLRKRQLMRLVLAAQCLIGAAALPNVIGSVVGAQGTISDYTTAAVWAGTNLTADARVLIHDAGTIAYRTTLSLTDVVGLKSPASVADHRRWTAPSQSAERFRAVDAIARRVGATHAIILDDRPDHFWGALADDLRKAGWQCDLIFSTGREGGYRIYRLMPPVDAAAGLRATLS